MDSNEKRFFASIWSERKLILIHLIVLIVIAYIFTEATAFLFGWEKFNSKATDIAQFMGDNKIIIELILATIIMVMYILIRFIYLIYTNAKMSFGAGLYFYSPNSNDKIVSDWEVKIKNLANSCNTIRILGATGKETFVLSDSPLVEAIQTCDYVQIILWDPTSKEIEQRIKDLYPECVDNIAGLMSRVTDYKGQIYESIKFLNKIRSRPGGEGRVKVELKFYIRYPSWKIVIFDGYCLVQRYLRDKHVKNTSCYGFQKLKDHSGLFTHFKIHFRRQWDSGHLGTYDFDTAMIEYNDFICTDDGYVKKIQRRKPISQDKNIIKDISLI